MAVTAFGLKNFMAFGAAGFGLDGFVEFRKINLLYGRNSHGKSVMIRALRLLKQSLSVSDEGPFRFADAGGVDLGSFEAVLHKSPQEKEPRFYDDQDLNWSRPISFRFRCEITKQQLTDAGKQEWLAIEELSQAFAEDVLCFELSLSYSVGEEKDTKKKGIFLVGFDLWLVAARFGGKKRKRLLTLQRDPDLDPEWSGYSDADLPMKNSVALASCFTKECLNGFLPALGLADLQQEMSDKKRKQLNEIPLVWSACRQEIESFLHSILYIGPIRPLPVRYYLIDRRERASVYWEGAQAYQDYLLNPSDSKYMQERLDFWMAKFELGHSVRLNKENQFDTKDGLVSIRELLVSEAKKTDEDQAGIGDLNLKDMGFGASQILPIIISCLVAKEDAFIVIEQPELHLHPEAQADTAGLFIECVNEYSSQDITGTDKEFARGQRRVNKSDSKQQDGSTSGAVLENKQSLTVSEERPRVARRCLIETHSEHLLRMLQRLIAETALYELRRSKQEETEKIPDHTIGKKDFCVFFVARDREARKSHIEHIQTDHIGRFMKASATFRSFFERDNLDLSGFKVAAAKIINSEVSDESSDKTDN